MVRCVGRVSRGGVRGVGRELWGPSLYSIGRSVCLPWLKDEGRLLPAFSSLFSFLLLPPVGGLMIWETRQCALT